MGGRTAAEIAGTLIENGLPPATPVAVAGAVSRPNERHWTGRLDALGATMIEFGTDRPVLIGIGEVFAAVAAKCESRLRAGAAQA
jgi:uroporphyrin-III C-methyltransferase/precorrin-2 dehydrogenase/sirohydrochlorin ferrochelatase